MNMLFPLLPFSFKGKSNNTRGKQWGNKSYFSRELRRCRKYCCSDLVPLWALLFWLALLLFIKSLQDFLSPSNWKASLQNKSQSSSNLIRMGNDDSEASLLHSCKSSQMEKIASQQTGKALKVLPYFKKDKYSLSQKEIILQHQILTLKVAHFSSPISQVIWMCWPILNIDLHPTTLLPLICYIAQPVKLLS